MREENEALERSVAVAKGELDQMTTIFEAHARFLKVHQCQVDQTTIWLKDASTRADPEFLNVAEVQVSKNLYRF